MANESVSPGTDELKLLRWLDRMDEESSAYKGECTKHWKESLRQFQGDQWRIRERPPYFMSNMIRNQVQRKVASLTEAKPSIKVMGLRTDLSQAAYEITQACKAIWDYNQMDMSMYRLGITGMTLGCGFLSVYWDASKDEIMMRPVDPALVWIDPAVSSPESLCDAAYIITESYDTLANIRSRFLGRGMQVKADPAASSYREKDRDSTGGVVSAVLKRFPRYFKPGGAKYKEGPIERATLREYWIRDPQIDMEGNLLFPGGRHIIRSKDVILVDEPNPYWDGMFPVDMFDWNMHFDHPWGEGEVYELRKLQEAFNRIGDGIIRNALISNNVKVIGDIDALEPDKWDELTNESGIVIKKRPGRDFSYEMPGEMPAYLFQLMTNLLTFADMQTGNTDSGGSAKTGGQVVSASALEGLQAQSQLLVRSVARKFESLLERVGQKMISRVFQFYTSDRMLQLLGPSHEWIAYSFEREKILKNDKGELHDYAEREKLFNLFRFLVIPGSSLASTRVQRVMMALNLRGAIGAPVPSIKRILQDADYGDPDELIREGLDEAKRLGLSAPTKPPKKK